MNGYSDRFFAFHSLTTHKLISYALLDGWMEGLQQRGGWDHPPLHRPTDTSRRILKLWEQLTIYMFTPVLQHRQSGSHRISPQTRRVLIGTSITLIASSWAGTPSRGRSLLITLDSLGLQYFWWATHTHTQHITVHRRRTRGTIWTYETH